MPLSIRIHTSQLCIPINIHRSGMAFLNAYPYQCTLKFVTSEFRGFFFGLPEFSDYTDVDSPQSEYSANSKE